jgi:hypothetical protein
MSFGSPTALQPWAWEFGTVAIVSLQGQGKRTCNAPPLRLLTRKRSLQTSQLTTVSPPYRIYSDVRHC